jgi:hypothetical protein
MWLVHQIRPILLCSVTWATTLLLNILVTCTWFLGIEVKPISNGLIWTQHKYSADLLALVSMSNFESFPMPLSNKLHYTKDHLLDLRIALNIESSLVHFSIWHWHVLTCPFYSTKYVSFFISHYYTLDIGRENFEVCQRYNEFLTHILEVFLCIS